MTSTHRSALAFTTSLLAGIVVLSAAGCTATSDPSEVDDVGTLGSTFEEWEKTVFREEGTGIYIVNGDTPIVDQRQLREFYRNYVQKGALIVHQAGGVDAKWDATQKVNLTYCVSKGFGGNYQKVVNAMATATSAWQGAANVKYVHVAAQDENCTASNQNVLFDVSPISGQQYLARAFFPDQSRSTRNVMIDSSSFGTITPYTLEGILRHELGHTLGFRHEHTRPEAGTCFEDNNYRALTEYDSNSVMHYPQCNGTQKGDLVLTAQDKAGAASLYGAAGSAQPPSNPNPNPGQPATCAHAICEAGGALTASCDACATKVCAADSYCCTTKWDSVCVGEVSDICGAAACQAAPPASACVHTTCEVGTKLTDGCDSCVSSVCAADAYCCNNQWDKVCVNEATSACGLACK